MCSLAAEGASLPITLMTHVHSRHHAFLFLRTYYSYADCNRKGASGAWLLSYKAHSMCTCVMRSDLGKAGKAGNGGERTGILRW